MSAHARIWVATCAGVGVLAAAVAASLLWLILVHPVRLMQALAGWP